MLPGQDFTEVIGFELTRDNWMLPGVCGGLQPHDLSSFLAVPAPALGGTLDPTVSTSALSTMGSSGSALMMLESDDQYLDTDDASEVTIKLHTLRSGEPHKSTLLSSYLGRSSVTEIVRKAYEMRAELAPDIKTGPKLRPRLWKRPAVSERARSLALLCLITWVYPSGLQVLRIITRKGPSIFLSKISWTRSWSTTSPTSTS